MKENYNASLRGLLDESEGGNDDDPRDPGGRTSRGIVQSEWSRWRETHPGLPADVWQAPQDQVEAIYKEKYWDVLRCDELPAGVDYAVFDFGVNSGVSRSAKFLQRLLGVDQDGEIGPNTIAAARAANAASLVNQICDARLAFLKGLRTWGTFGNGWGKRVERVRSASLQMTKSAPVTREVTKPQPAPQTPPQPAPAKPRGGLFELIVRLVLSLFGKRKPTQPPTPTPAPAPASPELPPWLVNAYKYVGFREKPGNRGIDEFIKLAHCGSEGDPWCAIFVNANLEAVDVPGTRSAMARSFERHPNFVKLDGPALGAIATMWRNSPGSGLGHVGFYAGENDRGVLFLGGNQSDGVRLQYEPRSRIVGYYWPKSRPLPKTGRVNIKHNDELLEGSEV